MTATPDFFAAAAGVLWWQIALAVIVGAAIGLATGWFAVWIERREKLEEEEIAERDEAERDYEKVRAKAIAAGEDAPEYPGWQGEKYGWTWLERILSPVLTAFLFGIFTYHQGLLDTSNHLNAALPIHLLWIAIFVHVLAFDLKHRLILNVITYPGVVLALALSPVTPGLGFGPAAVGAVICALFFLIFSVVSRGGVGLGDAKLGAVIGAIGGFDLSTGRFQSIYALSYGVFLGGATAVLLLITRVKSLKDPIPYGPFLCAGAALVLYTYS